MLTDPFDFSLPIELPSWKDRPVRVPVPAPIERKSRRGRKNFVVFPPAWPVPVPPVKPATPSAWAAGPTFVQQVIATFGSLSSVNQSLTLSSAPKQGNTLVFYAYQGFNSTTVSSLSCTGVLFDTAALITQNGGFGRVEIWRGVAVGSSPSATVNITYNNSSGKALAGVSEFSGVVGMSPLDQSTSTSNGFTANPTTGTTGTTAQASELAFAIIGDISDMGGGCSASAGYTSLTGQFDSTNAVTLFGAYKVLTATGTQSCVFTPTTNGADNPAAIVTLKGGLTGPVLIQQSTNAVTVAATTNSVTIATPSTGNLIAVGVGWASNSITLSSLSLTGVSSFASADGNTNTAMSAQLQYGMVTSAGGTSVTATFSSAVTSAIHVSEWFNIQTAPLDLHTNSTGTSTTPDTGTTGTTNSPEELSIGVLAWASGATVSSGPTQAYTALTEIDDGTALRLKPAYKILTAAGTTHTGYTVSSSSAWVGVVGTFIAAGQSTPIAGSDSGSLSDPAPSLSLTGIADSAAESDVLNIALASTDAASETESPAIGIPRTDSASLSEPSSIPISMLPAVESLSLSEATSISVQRNDSDSASISELVAVAISVSDAISLSESPSVSIPVSDGATEAESASTAIAILPVDSAVIGESFAISSSLVASDPLFLAESPSITSPFGVSDSASLADPTPAVGPSVPVDPVSVTESAALGVSPLTDALTATDTAQVSVNVFDSGVGSESASISAPTAVSDGIVESDILSISVPSSDSAAMSDSAATGQVNTVFASDAATASESVFIVVSVSSSDSASTAESVSIQASASASDSAAGSESLVLSASVSQSDAASTSDSVSGISLGVSDSGSMADLLPFSLIISASESVSLTEALSALAALSASDFGATLFDSAAVSVSAQSITGGDIFSMTEADVVQFPSASGKATLTVLTSR